MGHREFTNERNTLKFLGFPFTVELKTSASLPHNGQNRDANDSASGIGNRMPSRSESVEQIGDHPWAVIL